MNGTAWSVLTVVAWGIWLLPLHPLREAEERCKTFWITLGIFGIAFGVAAYRGFEDLSWNLAVPAFIGGLFWAGSGLAAVKAVSELGLARAMGIWSPLNVLISMIWGTVLFSEFHGWLPVQLLTLSLAVLVMLSGILLIVRARSDQEETTGSFRMGLLYALIAGVGWGSYFFPLRWAGVSPWVGAFPLAAGMWTGSLIPLLLRSTSRGASVQAHAKLLPLLALASALLWSLGNYGSLFMMEAIGTGRGFTVAQGCVVVNALVGVLVLRDPSAKSVAGRRVLMGVCLAAVGAVTVGLIKG